MNTKIVQVKRALISVSDKNGVLELAKVLSDTGAEIISTGGTAKLIAEAKIPVKEISDFTGFPEMMDGRVKTLHPLVHGGLLGLRDKHAEVAQQNNIQWIDLVVVNLYPFIETTKKSGVTEEEIIENIDIGGPSMIRSAAKNIGWVTVVVDKDDYAQIIKEIQEQGGITYETRKRLSAKAFSHTAFYDSAIAKHFQTEQFPKKVTLGYEKFYDLRYGENPHQIACVYRDPANQNANIINAKIFQGKQLSYNNIGDADAALELIKEFNEPACAVIKHANPCGAATALDINDAFNRAYHADSLSAFGGIIVLNRHCTKDIAQSITKVFAEIVLAPDYDEEALTILAQKPNLRVLALGDIVAVNKKTAFKQVDGGLLMQDNDYKTISPSDLKVVTKRQPTPGELNSMLFAWKVIKHIKSNAILIAKDNATVGVGAGQVSRVDAVDIAIKKAGTNIAGAVLASDAFFPFRDSIDKIAAAGIKAIVQPGGSIKDNEVITACDEHDIAMVFTGTRCFKH